jgi:hypothetical protein
MVRDSELIEAVPPVQLAIRLLVPQGSWLLKLPGFESLLDAFDPDMLGYPWRHPDPAMDALQREVERIAADAEANSSDRHLAFGRIWRAAHAAGGISAPDIPPATSRQPVPCLSEQWYCCAEPTAQQLRAY